MELDYPAVMNSRPRLWEIFGEAWGWPPDTMTFEEDRDELDRHASEIEAHESCNDTIFDADGRALLGSDLEDVLEIAIPVGIANEWPLTRPRYIGRDLTWAEWRERAGA